MNHFEFTEARRAAMARTVLTATDEEYLIKLERYMKRLARQSAKAAPSQPPYTLEELNTRLDEAEADIAANRVMTCEEANAEVRKALPWLK
ncbi:hypothetical protein AAE250_14735 [Bacteroides sp. GD17]|uniref:hypothetical protein n=1 Tax=Bacteroides sp. GD17 TaxID=3139826 RepID=UPI0025E54D41|nr:hypothetical protein [uncultured Bacteroides sp.]